MIYEESDLLCYKIIEISREGKLDYFLDKHSTKEGTWGIFRLESGEVDFVFLNGKGEALANHHLSDKENIINVPPAIWHKLSNPSDDFKATISFYCKRWRYFNKRYKLNNVHRDFLSFYHNYKMYGRHLNILDVGCGSGRNLLFLAKDNHSVTGLDIKEDAIKNIIDIAEKEKIKNVIANVCDLNDKLHLSPNSFDLVVSTVSLQFIENDIAPLLIHELMDATSIDGMHFLVFPINDDVFKFPKGFSFLPGSKELYHLYQDSGWSILDYKEDVGQLHRRDENGRPIQGVFATLLAQKVR